MPKRALIYLHSIEPLQTSWVELDEANNIMRSVTSTSVPENLADADIIAVIPAQDVLLTQANLPKMNKQRLMQALPFALEEQLLDDVENLHFAVSDSQIGDSLPVAVISKLKIQAWLNALKAANISPSAMVPLTFALPFEHNTWHINTHEDICTVRTGKFSGFTCEPDNLKTFLDLKLAEEKDKESIQMFRSKLSETQLLEQSATQILNDLPINLLQGEYRAKRKATQVKKIWLLAGGLAAAWIVVALFSSIVSFFILHHQVSNIENSINVIYKRNFPQATSVVAPRQRMEEKLKASFAQANQNNFLALLSLLAKSKKDNNGIRFQSLDFREKQLTLEVIADNFDALDTFSEALIQQGLSLKRQNAAISGAQVKANLLIKAGEA